MANREILRDLSKKIPQLARLTHWTDKLLPVLQPGNTPSMTGLSNAESGISDSQGRWCVEYR
jgi:hypothetical protein